MLRGADGNGLVKWDHTTLVTTAACRCGSWLDASEDMAV